MSDCDSSSSSSSSSCETYHSKRQNSKNVLVKGAENFYYTAGIRFDKFNINDKLIFIAASVGEEIVIMNPKTGAILERISTIPIGFSVPDDLDIGPDTGVDSAGITRGTIYVTAGPDRNKGGIGRIHPDGTSDVIVPNILFTNGISFSPDGKRLYISQVFNITGPNGVYEILNFDDPNPTVPTIRVIVPNIDSFGGGLEGFVTGNDGFIYGPLWYDGSCVKINPNGTFPTNVTPIPSDKEPFYGTSHTAFDSCGRLYVSDIMGRLVRIDNLITGKSKVLGNYTMIDTVFLDSSDRVYISGGNLADIAQIVCKDNEYHKRAVSKSGLSSAGNLAIVNNELFIANFFLLSVYNKCTGKLERNINQKDLQPNANLYSFQTQLNFTTVSPMPNNKLLISSIIPSGRFAILDVHNKCKVSLTSFFLANPVTFLPLAAVALNSNTLITAGVDAVSQLAIVQKIILNGNYKPIGAPINIPVPGLVLPVSLANSKDGSNIWISDYFGGSSNTGAIYMVNTRTFAVTPIITTGLQFPQGIALSNDEKHLLFLEEGTSSLKSIDLQNPSKPPVVVADNLGALNVQPDFTVRFIPQGVISYVTIDPCTETIYVLASGERVLWEINTTQF